MDTTQLITLVVLLALSAVFSASETAFYSLSKLKVRNLVQQKRAGALALARLKDNPKRLLTTILIGNTLAMIGVSALTTVISTNYFGSKGVGIATGVATVIILIFGEITPKSMAAVSAERTALFFAKPLEILSYILYPVLFIIEIIVHGILKVFGADKEQPLITEQEIKAMIQVGAEENVIERKQKELMDGVLEFNDITAFEAMTPRVRMFCLAESVPLKEALPQIIQEGFSRVPVYRSTRDKITGIIHIKDLIREVEVRPTAQLKDIAQKPFFISKETVLSELLKEFQQKHLHMAIVVDEFGGTAGLVTLEDLFEEIVGEIMDEGDLSPETIMRVDKNTVVVHGDTEIDKLNHFFNVEIPVKKNYVTLSGFLHFLLRSIPQKGATTQYKNLTFTVEEVIDNKPLKVRVKKEVQGEISK